jgi:hypothetical protein
MCPPWTAPSVAQAVVGGLPTTRRRASLQACGLKLGAGKIVDAGIVGAQSSNKNAGKQRDLKMHQTRAIQQRFSA